jgi:hypothetical protein
VIRASLLEYATRQRVNNDSYTQGNVEALRALPLSDSAKALILGGNAARLLGLA